MPPLQPTKANRQSETEQVDVMRSRAIRRVQWRLENGPLLLSFAKDQAPGEKSLGVWDSHLFL